MKATGKTPPQPWGRSLKPSIGEMDALRDENTDLKRKLAEARRQKKDLEKSVHEKTVTKKCGYLNKYRPFESGIFSVPWAPRFFCLVGNSLLYYKNEQDILHPRGQIDLSKDIFLEIEGMKLGRYWTFCLVDSTGGSLMRLSTENKPVGEQWVSAIKGCGCEVIEIPSQSRHKSPRPPSTRISHRPSGADLKDLAASSESPASSETSLQKSTKQQQQQPTSIAGGLTPSSTPASSVRHRASRRSESSEVSEGGGSESTPPAPPPPAAVTPPRSAPRAGLPVHKSRYSLLSSESISKEKHHGLLNLAVVILLVTNGRLIVENILKYGFKAGRASFYFGHPMRSLPLLYSWMGMSTFALAALGLEKWAAARDPGRGVIPILHLINTAASLVLPCWVVHSHKPDLLISLLFMLVVLTNTMKLVSFAHVNSDLRRLRREEGESPFPLLQQQLKHYPGNLTVPNMAYFLTAPTLCYQAWYPQSSRLRKRWLFRRIVELAICVALLAILIEQYIYPATVNSLKPLEELELGRVFERLLKLSIPVLYFWLVMFYLFFHLWMNILAEILRFGDREFYRAWWNANDIEQYWRLWNMPVHNWLVRHVYFPCLHLTKSRDLSVFMVFVLSAIFHELVIGVPMNLLRGWAFFGIISQVPLIRITSKMNKFLRNEQAGNIFFWFVFCIFGQPMCILLYMHDYSVANRTSA